MARAVPVPIKIWRRTNDPAVIWRFRAAPGPTGALATLADDYELTVDLVGQPAAFVRRVSDGGLLIDRTAGLVTWPYTLAESALVPLGDGHRYELMGTTAGRTRLWAGGPLLAQSFRS